MFKKLLVLSLGLMITNIAVANVAEDMIKQYPVEETAFKQVMKPINVIGSENPSTFYYQENLSRLYLVDNKGNVFNIILNRNEIIKFRKKVDTVLDNTERTGENFSTILKAHSAEYEISAYDTLDGAVVKLCNSKQDFCVKLDVENALTITESISTDVLYYDNPHNNTF